MDSAVQPPMWGVIIRLAPRIFHQRMSRHSRTILVGENIQRRTRESAALKPLQQRFLDDQLTAGCVDEIGSLFHGFKHTRVEKSSVIFAQIYVQADYIGLVQHIGGRHALYRAIDTAQRLPRIRYQYSCVKRRQVFRNDSTQASVAEKPNCFSVQFSSLKRIAPPIPLRHIRRGCWYMS
jgi:hypothetical protein